MSDRSYSLEEYHRARRRSEPEEHLAGQLQQSDLPAAIREYRFHKPRRWRFDFAWPDRMLAVEVEGLTRDPSRGGHQSHSGYRSDLEKYNAAALAGWTVLRFEQGAIYSGEALTLIEQALREKEIAR